MSAALASTLASTLGALGAAASADGAALLATQWLLACAGCVATGLAAWLLLQGASRLWPALYTRRNVWLAAQCAVAIAALLPFLPHPAQLRLAPQIDLAAQVDLAPALTSAAPSTASAASAPFAVSAVSTAPAAPATAAHAALAPPPAPPVATDARRASAPAAATLPPTATPSAIARTLPLLAAVWLLIYNAGLARAVVRQWQARRLWRDLLASAQRLSPAELHAHGAFTAGQLREIAQHKLPVLRTGAAISPMLLGVYHPHLLLPVHLEALSTTQQQMIIAHELHHWRARDPLCLAIAAILQTIFWFNPTLRWMAKQMEWALELHCDQHVLAGRPQHQRKLYAASLLQQWTAMTPIGVAAFNGATITARVRHMQKDSLPTLSATAGWMTGGALAAVLAASALLQPALAFSIAAAPAATPAAAPTEAWRAPLDNVRVTSFYGVVRSVLPTPHKGIDFAAAKGTPIHAVASGTVIAAGAIAENDGRYGNVVIIDHGTQRSFFAHLNSVSVTPGQRVHAGQLIGAVGQSGFATGPHLHMEVRQNGQIIDPATMYPNLDAYAIPRALKVRRQQLPSKG